MNNYFLEGPIQTGKSTYLRKILRAEFGSTLTEVAGFTSQRHIDEYGQILGFSIAPASAPIMVVHPSQGSAPPNTESLLKQIPSEAFVSPEPYSEFFNTPDPNFKNNKRSDDADFENNKWPDIYNRQHMFKWFDSAGVHVNMNIFETYGVQLLEEAIDKINSGRAKIVLLDEIGGHEMACTKFREALYKLLDSDIRCVGVIKHPASAKRMDPSIVTFNEELHKQIVGFDGSGGEIVFFEKE